MGDDNKISAVTVASIGGMIADSGTHALLKIVREKPDRAGKSEFYLAVKVQALPTIAALCLNLMAPPQKTPGKKDRAIVPADTVEIGMSDNGQYVVTYELETKAPISFAMDYGQARTLAEGLAALLGGISNPETPQTRPN